MHKQPLARHIEAAQQQIINLQQHASALYPQHPDTLAQIFATIAQALEELQQLEPSPQINGSAQIDPDHHLNRYETNGYAIPELSAAPRARSFDSGALLSDPEIRPHAADSYCENEQALQYQLQITRTITDNATACLFMIDVRGRCTFMNPAAEQVTGYTFAEMQGQILHDLIHHTRPDGTPYPLSECPLGKVLAENIQIRVHHDLFVRKDGSFFPVICSASPIVRDGIPIGTVIEVRDISDSKQAEYERDQLFEAEQRSTHRAQHQAEQLRGLTAASIAINGVLSVDEVLQLITEQARRLIGAHQVVSSLTINHDWAQSITAISLSEKYQHWKDYNVPPDGSGIYVEVCRTNAPMRMTQAELELHPGWRNFGSEAHAHPPMRGWLAAPFISRDGRNIGLIQLSDKYEGDFTSEDESVVVQLAQMAAGALENARLYSDAQEAIRARNEFLSVASHELNTPVTSVRGYAQLLARQIDKGVVVDPDRALRALRAIEQQSIKLSQLISQLLDISRIESGRLILNRQPTNISRLAQDIAATLETTTSKHYLVVHAPDSVIIDIDPLRLEQVLTNLIGNAIKYSPEGGTVRIEVSQPTSESIAISVTDDGIGIPPEHRPHIFDRFYQAHGSGYFGGLGLGLSISQQIVVLHGGELLAQFPAEGGTRFVVRLPVQIAEPQASPPQ